MDARGAPNGSIVALRIRTFCNMNHFFNCFMLNFSFPYSRASVTGLSIIQQFSSRALYTEHRGVSIFYEAINL